MDWKSLVRNVAPTLATALGGPMAGMAFTTVSNAILGKPDGTDDQINFALAGDPDLVLKLKTADQGFKVKMKELDIDLDRINAEDRASARQRQIDTGDKTPAILAYLLTFMFALALAGLYFIALPETNKATVYLMLGSLGMAWAGAMIYYHGSTSGSAKKNKLLAEMKPNRS